MEIILVRHGETEENKRGIIQGHLPGTLSEEGIRQAKRVAERLSKERIDKIISSDLSRAKDTAEIIRTFHPEADFELNESLRERNLGVLQGKRKLEDLGIPRDKKLADLICVAEDAESSEELIERAKKLIEHVQKDRSKKKIVLVGHNGINKAIIFNLLNGKNDLKEIPAQDNVAVTIFELNDEGNAKLKLMNCTKHLY